jgi:hypothetical protein
MTARTRIGQKPEARPSVREDFIMPQNACMPEVTVAVPGYDPARGAIIQPEGGDVLVRHGKSGVEILADPAGLRDLARWCLVLADEQAPDGTHVHLEPGTEPLTTTSMPLLISRESRLAI